MIIKPIIRKLCILSLFLPLATGMFFLDSWAQQGIPSPSNQDQEPVNLTADRMLQLVEKNLVKAEGNVVVTYGARTVSADEIIINTETGKGQAKGNVVMTAEQGTRFQADNAQFNMKAEKGRLFNVAGKLGDLYYITGEELTKLSGNHYTAHESTLTTCEGEVPDWRIDVADADLVLDDRALFKGGVFRIRGVPIMYIPIGYVPILTKRKSGLLTPKFANSDVDGVTVGMTYFWAINKWSDATIGLDWMKNRGIRSRTEYRYTPSKTTSGQVNFIFLDDDLTQETFWKLDATHSQHLPLGFTLNAKLDQTSKANYNSIFQDQTELRTRRNSNSYASFFRKWDNHSFDILARYWESEQFNVDQTLGLLPTVTYKTQPIDVEFINAYFDLETSYTHFLNDFDPTQSSDVIDTTQRVDFHPNLSLPIDIASWLQLTPRVGFRETFYNKELQVSLPPVSVTRNDSFSRELMNVNVSLEGPKFNRIFLSDDSNGASYKHVIEPRFQYDFISDWDRNDRAKIRIIDGIDAIEDVNKLSYFLVQRLLKKGGAGSKSMEVNQIARLEISQSYDFDGSSGIIIPGSERRPFSPIRFDLDSQISENFFLNTDFSFNIYTNNMETWNIDTGIKLSKWLMMIFERREKDDLSATIRSTLDITLPKGWNAKYSIRFDEFNDTLLEQNARLTYNDKCMCWGFTIDYVDRNNFFGPVKTNDTRILFSISLKGFGNIYESKGSGFIHRSF